jgi:DNA-binding response OmpR family regulator/anti-sigma regulatory factor (Ser/Thr protein kinase)
MTKRAQEQQARVLVVEDDPDTRRFLDDLLRLEGYQPVLAASGAEALDALAHQPVDLMLLDLMLPDVSGYDVCEQVRHSATPALPILMMSALSQPHHVVRGFDTGANEYLKKPLMADELIARMQYVLRRHQASQQTAHENAKLQMQLATMQHAADTLAQASATETLLRQEFLHNVATHLQALCGIVDAETRKLAPSPERDTVQRIRARVYGAALVYQTADALRHDPVALGPLIRTITTAIKAMYRPWRRVRVTVTGDDTMSVANHVAAPLAMVVNELVTNCCKHAFPDNAFGTITVNYGMEEATIELTVADNGVGFNVEQPTIGQGRAAVTQLVQGVGGTVEWHSTSHGTTVTVRVPCA